MVKIDKFDRKILYELEKNSSITITEIAKKIGRSKEFTLFRIERLEKMDIIENYTAIIDMQKLGYFTFRVYFRLQNITKEQREKIDDFLKSDDNIWSITYMHGKWDYAIFIGVKIVEEFHKVWNRVLFEYKEMISEHKVALYTPIYNFNKIFFLDDKESVKEERTERVYGISKRVKFDELDLKIIKNYAINVRIPISSVAGKLGVSPDTARARIKRLENEKVIVGYKIDLNLQKLNMQGYRVDLSLNSIKRNKQIFEYCKQHKNFYQINNSIGGADFELEVIVRDLNHLFEIMNDLVNKFSDVIKNYEYMGFSLFPKLAYIPD